MGRHELEKKILQEKAIRKYEIGIKILMFISILLVIWFLFSWGEVIHHNDVYYSTGEVTNYSPINLFEVVKKLL